MSKTLTRYIVEGIRRDSKLSDVETITYPDGTTINISDVESKFHLSVMSVLNNFPYFAPAIQSLVPILTNGVDTMATDGIRIFFNPKFTDKLSINECVFVIIHECMHCILNHMYREKMNNFEHERGNIAADYEVNGILENDGMVKKGTTNKLGGLIDSKYFGWSFERIYADCSSSAPKPQSMGNPSSSTGDPDEGDQDGNQQNQNGSQSQNSQGQQGGNQQNGQQGQGGSQGQSSGQGSGQSGQGSGPGGGQGSGQSGQGSGQSGNVGGSQGTAASRKERSGEVSKIGGSYIDVKTGEQLAKEAGYSDREMGQGSDSDVNTRWGKIAKDVASRIGVGGGRGNSLLDAINEIYKPKINWRAELKRIIGHAVGGTPTDMAWGRKMFLHQDEIRRFDKPSDTNLSNVIFMVDTSGSVGQKKLIDLMSESSGMVAAKKIPAVTYVSYGYGVAYIDTIKTKEKLTSDQIKKLKLGDGGGTDFKKSVEEVGAAIKKGSITLNGEKIKIKMSGVKKADLLVVFTDGDSINELNTKPSWAKNVVFLVIPHGSSFPESQYPPYGKTLVIPED